MLSAATERALRAAGGTLLTDPGECLVYGYDNSRRQGRPVAVALPESHEQVRALVRACAEGELDITLRGRGTNTVGASVPADGSLVLSFERMGRILEVNAADRLLVCEAGATNAAVQRAAAAAGFFWPPDPTSAEYCSVGGNLACNAGGPRAVKYGTCRENTLGLRAVTAQGDDLRTGSRTTKGVVGYDLTRLLIGSEGQLAVITEATLRLVPLPAERRSLRAIYTSLAAAAAAVARIMAQPQLPCALEFMDGAAVDLVRDAAGLPAEAGALLLLAADGDGHGIAHTVAALRDAAQAPELLEFRAAADEAEETALWQARKALSPALRRLAPKKVNEDVVVPVSQLPSLVAGLEKIGAESGLRIVNFGHAGNGNVHVNILADDRSAAQMAALPGCLSAVFDLVLSLGGSLSGEHGIGLEKRAYLSRELPPAALSLMAGIKQAFDPQGRLNPLQSAGG